MKKLVLLLVLLAGCGDIDPHQERNTLPPRQDKLNIEFNTRLTELEVKVDKILSMDLPVPTSKIFEVENKIRSENPYTLGTWVKSTVSGDTGMIIQTMKPEDKIVKVKLKGWNTMIFDWYPAEIEIIPPPKSTNDK